MEADRNIILKSTGGGRGRAFLEGETIPDEYAGNYKPRTATQKKKAAAAAAKVAVKPNTPTVVGAVAPEVEDDDAAKLIEWIMAGESEAVRRDRAATADEDERGGQNRHAILDAVGPFLDGSNI